MMKTPVPAPAVTLHILNIFFNLIFNIYITNLT